MMTACAVGAFGYLLALLYVVLFLPESQPPQERSQLACKKLIPGVAVAVLGHNSFTQMIAVVAAVGGFQVNGWNVVRARFQQQALHWSRQNNYTSEVMSNLSQFVWLFFGAAL